MENNDNNTIYEYTIVLDGDYLGTNESEEKLGQTVARQAPEAESGSPEQDARADMDKLYAEYEKMCYRNPNVLDKDDAYPHTYQWRMGDRYDPAKKTVLEAALKYGVKIADTDAYRQYVEAMTNRRFMPDSWD